MGIYRYAIYKSGKIKTVIGNNVVEIFPLRFFCNDRDLYPLFNNARSQRLGIVLGRMHSSWNEIGPNYCFHDCRLERDSKFTVYENPRKIISFHDGGEWPLNEIGTVHKFNGRWIFTSKNGDTGE
jgi:hypothetical protein